MLIALLQNPYFLTLIIVFFALFVYVIVCEEYIPAFIFIVFASLSIVLKLSDLGAIGLLKAVLLMFLFGTLVYKNLKKGLSMPVGGIGLIVIYILSVYISGEVNNVPFVNYRSEIGLLIMAIVISLAPNNMKTLNMLSIVIFFWGLANAFVVITAKLGIGWGGLEVFNQGGRAIGLTGHSTTMGAYFSISLIAAQVLFIKEQKKTLKMILLISGVLLMLGLLSTIARGAFVGWLVAFLFIQYRVQGMKLSSVFGILAISIVGFFVASMLGLDQMLLDRFTGMEKDSSAQARIPLLLASLETLSKHLFLGTGVGWVDVKMLLQSHNMFMQVLVETGVIGFCLFMSILWKTGWGLLRRSKTLAAVSTGQSVFSEKSNESYSGVSTGDLLRQSENLSDVRRTSFKSVGLLRDTVKKELVPQGDPNLSIYYIGFVAMLGAILLNGITHSFDYFMPFWILVGVAFMKWRK